VALEGWRATAIRMHPWPSRLRQVGRWALHGCSRLGAAVDVVSGGASIGAVQLPGSKLKDLHGRLTQPRVLPALAVVCPPPGGFVSPPPAPDAPEEPLAPPDDPMDVLPCGYVFPKRELLLRLIFCFRSLAAALCLRKEEPLRGTQLTPLHRTC
jgi:hypothetical protein